MVRLCSAKDVHHIHEQPIGTRPHVDGLDRQPHRVDADHRSISRIHAAQSAAADAGQVTAILVGPRVSSTRMSAGTGGAGNCTGTKLDGALRDFGGVTACDRWGLATQASASTTQRRTKLALTPLANATEAIDTPGLQQAETTWALNSGLCRRRRRRPSSVGVGIVFTCPPKVKWTRAS
jgi:hypothetical protein